MKIRNGFVSNSSSSSFVCCVCRKTQEWNDWGDDEDYTNGEFNMIGCECEYPHYMCKDHITEEDQKLGLIPGGELGNDKINKETCLICNFKHIERNTVLRFLTKDYNEQKINEIKEEIRKKFLNMDALNEFFRKCGKV